MVSVSTLTLPGHHPSIGIWIVSHEPRGVNARVLRGWLHRQVANPEEETPPTAHSGELLLACHPAKAVGVVAR
jgi:hypothetical protein